MISPTILRQTLWTSKLGSKKTQIVFAGLRPVEEKKAYLALMFDLVASGKFKSVIDRCYRFEQIAKAHRYVENGRKKGTVVIVVSQNTSK